MNRLNILSLCDYTGTMVAPWVEAGHHAFIVDTQHADDVCGVAEVHPSGGSLTRLNHNVCDLIDREGRSLCRWLRWSMIFAFPPCDNLAVSGSRWFKSKGLGGLVAALEVVEACRTICETSGAPYLIENPKSMLSTYWRSPDFTCHPWHFNAGRVEDSYTKTTCLWTGGGFAMPPRAVDPRTTAAMSLAAERYGDLAVHGDIVAAVRKDPDIDAAWFPDDRIHKKGPRGADRANFRSATPRGFADAVFAANAPQLAESAVA
jgi:hypothetical protein